MADEDVRVVKSGDTLAKIAALLGIVSTLVGVVVTISNWRLKTQLDAIDERLKERSTVIEESKERVARYTWVRTLFPDLTDPDPKKRAFTLSVMQLALNSDEAQQLFAGLSGSKDEALKEAGQAGLTSIQDQESAKLVAAMNAASATDRKASVQKLIDHYAGSTTAIGMALETLRQPGVVSPSGTINGLYYLANTEEQAWTVAEVKDAQAVVTRLEANSPGQQTAQAVSALKAKLSKIGKGSQ